MDIYDIQRLSFKDAIATRRLTTHKYLAHLPLDYCFGSNAHGGFLFSIIFQTVQQHFRTTLSEYKQPDPFDLHVFFIRPATFGEATLEIQDTKLGSKISTVHLSLSQNGKERAMAYVSVTNMATERGSSYPIGYTLHPAPAAANIAKLEAESDPNWVNWQYQWFPTSNLKASTHVKYYSPTGGSPHPSIMDYWLTPSSISESFTTEMLGSIADMWIPPAENYRPDSPYSSSRLAIQALQEKEAPGTAAVFSHPASPHAYPTLSMTLEVKKKLPVSGVRWLFLRARTLDIKNGRLDVEVTILDEKLEIVALSHHVTLVSFIADRTYRAAKGVEHKSSKL